MKPKIMTVAVLIMAMGVIACGKASAQDKKPKEDKGNKPTKLVLKKGEKSPS
jgi:hypothetical protein